MHLVSPKPELKILVIDDVPAVRAIMKELLRGMGFFQTLEASSAEAAWQFLSRHDFSQGPPVEMILCDWNLSGMSGLDLLKSVRGDARFKNIPFLIVTAQSTWSHQVDAREAGATDYVVKPFSSETLWQKICESMAIASSIQSDPANA